MPAESRTLAEEGVVIPPTRLDGRRARGAVARMRNPEERRGDFRAQLAAHRLAEQRLDELCARRGRDEVAAAMDELLRVLRARRARGDRAAPGRPLRGRGRARGDRRRAARSTSRVTIAGDAIEIDFAGTAPQHGGNLNCPLAVTRSASYFVVRCLTDPDLPASGGAFAPVDGHARRRAASSTRGRPRPSPRATSRPRAASSTSLFARVRRRRSTSRRRARGR